jgi:hypothetical protein
VGSSYRRRTGSRANALQRRDGLSLGDCSDWFAADVAIAVCNQRVLRRALATATFGSKPIAAIKAAGRKVGGGAGLAEAVGQPLRPGEGVTINASSLGGATLYIHSVRSDGTFMTRKQRLVGAAREVRISVPFRGQRPLTITVR